MSRPGFEPGPLAFWTSALPTELSGRITPGLISGVTLLSRSGATGSTLNLNGDHTQTKVLELELIIMNYDVCKVKCQRTPPESVYTSNNKYITNQESKANRMSPRSTNWAIGTNHTWSHICCYIAFKIGCHGLNFVCVCPPLSWTRTRSWKQCNNRCRNRCDSSR